MGLFGKEFDKFKEKIKSKIKSHKQNLTRRKEFLKGIKIVYETIINSFAKGDKKFKRSLTKEMRENFSLQLKKEIKT